MCLGKRSELIGVSFHSKPPPHEVFRSRQVVRLGTIAAVGDHEIFDCIARPARPSKEVVDLTSRPKLISAVEAPLGLKLAEVGHERPGEGDSIAAEEVGPQ